MNAIEHGAAPVGVIPTTDLRSGSAATDLVRDWEATGEIAMVKKPDVPIKLS